MFEVDIRVNGVLAGHVYGHRMAEFGDGLAAYEFEYYQPGKGTAKGKVVHRQDDGIRKLVGEILKLAEKELK